MFVYKYVILFSGQESDSSDSNFRKLFFFFEGFRSYVQESIDFEIEGYKERGTAYPDVFDGEYELYFKFDVRSLVR